MDKDEIIKRAVASVRRAVGYCGDVEFSPEDASRTEGDFLCQVVEAAIAAGATTVNIPDTVGYATPTHMGGVIRMLRNRVPNIDKAVISVHCHNDLGMAVANSLAAVEAGAGQVECTINGLGERAGNCSLEEVVMALRTRQDFYHAATHVNTSRLVPTSRLVANITGIQVQRNKAIVGQNAFAHEAGIHQDGMLKERTTYEIMRPEDVGFSMSDLVLGKHSGRAALADRAKAMGYTLTGDAARHGFRAVQNPGRQEEGNLRRRHRCADRAADARRGGTVDGRLVQGDLRHAARCPRCRSVSAAARRNIRSTSPAATVPSTRSSWPSSKPRAFRSFAATSTSTASRSARTPRARCWSRWSTMAGCIEAGPSRPTASRPAQRRFSTPSTGSQRAATKNHEITCGFACEQQPPVALRIVSLGRVAESADARDLKSRGLNRSCGFESRLGHLLYKDLR